MSKVLAISSMVACEAVGLTANRFALERLGHEVWALPTVQLSNHRGREHVACKASDCENLTNMFGAIEANDWLHHVDAGFTGYLPASSYVEFAKTALERIRRHNPDAIVLVDPILGEEGTGLYIDEYAASAIRDLLIPLADIATPNSFELSWLTKREILDREGAVEAMKALGPDCVLMTSLPDAEQQSLSSLLLTDGDVFELSVPLRAHAPHGVGDFLAAVFLAKRLEGIAPAQALGFAGRATQIVIDAIETADRLELVSSQDAWAAAEPLVVVKV